MFKSIRQLHRENQWTAFEAEALPHLSALFRLAMWLVRERAEAEDLVQDTFTQALQSFHRYEKGTNCRAWLIRVMFHINSNRRRASARLQIINETDERIAETAAFDPPTPQGLTEEEVLRALQIGRFGAGYLYAGAPIVSPLRERDELSRVAHPRHVPHQQQPAPRKRSAANNQRDGRAYRRDGCVRSANATGTN